MKLDILAIGVHPDDVELGCGATILKHVDLGYKVGILDLTQGELGTRGTAELRLQEAEAARAFAGVLIRDNLSMPDGFIGSDRTSKLSIAKKIRQYQPEIVLANAVRDRHPDHGNAAKLIYEACFLAGLLKIETSLDGVKQDKWRPRKLLNYIQDFNLTPNVVIDVSGYMDKKIEYVKCFKSQFFDPESSEDDTPISSMDFMEFLRARGRFHGRHIGAEYGEGFTCESYIGVKSLMDIL
ncbi:MAG: bacillithiol biosynthesis deacetylase BshB1 [Bacteroidia bacterium]|nr:bacillithiol biosynthesis deacetylase BshB1 [Bacteroidia bacterium]